MKTSFLLFFLVAVCIYAAGNLYLFVRGWQALEIIGRQRVWFAVAFWVAALSFIVTMMLRMKGASGALFDAFTILGSYWVAILLYGFLMLLAIDILRIAGWAGNVHPDFIYRNYPLGKVVVFGAVCLVMAAIAGFGYRNAHCPQAIRIEVPVDKKAGQLKKLRAVMVSDIHLGHVSGRKSLARIVDAINGQRPDIVFLAGDTFDGAPDPVIKKDMCVEFDRLQTKYGTYAVSGNHEYIGARENHDAVNAAFKYIASHGVQPLQDSIVLIDHSFYVAGRKDKAAGVRKTIPELLLGANMQLPVIVLDHQPYDLDRAAQAGVDLQLSGHTHHGQMWPMNHITRKIFEQDWGFLQKGKSNFYISCGAGTWGPPIRTAGRSEVVVIDLIFN